MFGALLRAAPQSLAFALLAALTAWVVGPMVDVMLGAESAATDDLLIWGLQTATDQFLLVGLFALVASLVARATVEGAGA